MSPERLRIVLIAGTLAAVLVVSVGALVLSQAPLSGALRQAVIIVSLPGLIVHAVLTGNADSCFDSVFWSCRTLLFSWCAWTVAFLPVLALLRWLRSGHA